MREIKFRAVMQRLDGVKYVSQAYSIDNNLSYLFDFENNRWDIFLEMITTEERFVELFPDDDEHLKDWTHIENIQYTGLKDKNGIEIYELDILQIELDWGYGPAKILSKVYFENGCFRAKALNSNEDTLLIELPPCEVVGNVYENPELLKEINENR